ncbi:hypothetical protein [Winogradskyella sp.]|uniref:hypothetical protein n=1 Tax=Winogradskyella sp. TaxID=1883156 RepID=UPI003BAC615F
MKTDFYIDKGRTLKPAEDFDFLRKEGQRYIESLTHKLWTDYNAHDPGITIMEILCYAITELGYRTNFDIEHILANANGKIENKSFFTAKQILTNAPLTVLDYRKVLIDVEGINNAWLIYGKHEKNASDHNLPLDNEIPVFVNLKEDKLSLKSLDDYDDVQRLPIRGLNKVVIELSDDMTLGELNNVALQYAWLDDDNNFVEVDITLEFDSWNHYKADWLRLMNTPSKIELKSIDDHNGTITVTIQRSSNNSQTLTLLFKTRDPDELNTVKDYFNVVKNISHVIDLLAQKKQKVVEIFKVVNHILCENRNLTEDWLCVETIGNIDVGICADLELENGFDAEEILAKVNQTIDEIFAPPIPFYTLGDMLNMGKSPREIFSGPSLTHGFLLDEDVLKADLKDCIHASDIIAAVLDIPGVKSVKNVLLTAYGADGKPLEDAKNQAWCLTLDGQKRAVFAYGKSKLLLFRDSIPFMIPEAGGLELSQGIVYLKTQNNSLKLENPSNDFPIPEGQYYELNEYYSIQNDFPETYRIGEGQLLTTSSDLRKAQAKQLKAYLLHFDQILTDFFNQLYQAKHLFDLDIDKLDKIDKTYFPKYVNTISGIDEITFADEAYSKDFENILLHGERDSDRSIYETEATFYDRRNRVLDHLMARFGESFNDYVLMTHMIQQNAQGLAELTLQNQELIDDKQRFLMQYPKLSYARGLGFNYCQVTNADEAYPWGIEQRGGYEKRIAALLGINSIVLGDIVDNVPKKTWTYQTAIGELKFRLLNSVTLPLEAHWQLAHELLHTISAYRVFTFSKSYIYVINSDHKKVARLDKAFESEKEAQDYISKLYQGLNSHLENFYLLEHILLRPLVSDENLTDEDLLTVCLNDDCYSEDHMDPYSFKATLVLPGWLARFRNRYFREYAETLCRQEAPAHCMIKICWVGRSDMLAFQNAYKKWLEAYKKLKQKYCMGNLSKTQQKQYNLALSELIVVFKELNTIYDSGILYDCKVSELDNPIILNNSSLGTLKKIEP